MKTIKPPVIKMDKPAMAESSSDKELSAKLDDLQIDRSYLPSSSDQPVHKCGCT